VLFIFYEEVLGGFAKGIAAGDDGVVCEDIFRHLSAVGKIPGVFCRGGVVFEVLHGAATFEQERREAVFAEFFCSPASADAGADDDGVVLVHMEALFVVI